MSTSGPRAQNWRRPFNRHFEKLKNKKRRSSQSSKRLTHQMSTNFENNFQKKFRTEGRVKKTKQLLQNVRFSGFSEKGLPRHFVPKARWPSGPWAQNCSNTYFLQLIPPSRGVSHVQYEAASSPCESTNGTNGPWAQNCPILEKAHGKLNFVMKWKNHFSQPLSSMLGKIVVFHGNVTKTCTASVIWPFFQEMSQTFTSGLWAQNF